MADSNAPASRFEWRPGDFELGEPTNEAEKAPETNEKAPSANEAEPRPPEAPNAS